MKENKLSLAQRIRLDDYEVSLPHMWGFLFKQTDQPLFSLARARSVPWDNSDRFYSGAVPSMNKCSDDRLEKEIIGAFPGRQYSDWEHPHSKFARHWPFAWIVIKAGD